LIHDARLGQPTLVDAETRRTDGAPVRLAAMAGGPQRRPRGADRPQSRPRRWATAAASTRV
jgi:hypothetical protein